MAILDQALVSNEERNWQPIDPNWQPPEMGIPMPQPVALPGPTAETYKPDPEGFSAAQKGVFGRTFAQGMQEYKRKKAMDDRKEAYFQLVKQGKSRAIFQYENLPAAYNGDKDVMSWVPSPNDPYFVDEKTGLFDANKYYGHYYDGLQKYEGNKKKGGAAEVAREGSTQASRDAVASRVNDAMKSGSISPDLGSIYLMRIGRGEDLAVGQEMSELLGKAQTMELSAKIKQEITNKSKELGEPIDLTRFKPGSRVYFAAEKLVNGETTEENLVREFPYVRGGDVEENRERLYVIMLADAMAKERGKSGYNINKAITDYRANLAAETGSAKGYAQIGPKVATIKATMGPEAAKSAGLQTAKRFQLVVGAGLEARALLAPLYNPETKTWDPRPISDPVVTELCMNLARMLTQVGAPGEHIINQLKQATLAGDWSRLVGYFGQRAAGTTEANLQILAETIDRVSRRAQQNYDAAVRGEPLVYEDILKDEKPQKTVVPDEDKRQRFIQIKMGKGMTQEQADSLYQQEIKKMSGAK